MTAAEKVAVDVAAEVLAVLETRTGPGPLAEDADTGARVAWWLAFADAEQARADAYQRLGDWAMATGLPLAVVLAIGDARALALADARQSRRDAERTAGGAR